MNKLLFVLILTFFVNNTTCFSKPNYSYNNIKMRTETNKCWNIKINSNPENVYYDWLNNVWYDSYFNNNLCNSKIISIGDIYGTNSIRSMNVFNTVNQIITNTTYPEKIEYKEVILPSINYNRGSIDFVNNNNSTELIWNINYTKTDLELIDKIVYKIYDHVINNTLKKLKIYSERRVYQQW